MDGCPGLAALSADTGWTCWVPPVKTCIVCGKDWCIGKTYCGRIGGRKGRGRGRRRGKRRERGAVCSFERFANMEAATGDGKEAT